ncbi:hypothetical protein AGMMS50212_16850 [Spirochaetia bacterium]|nr:hypothetical protein AGMMS50212_16850 [Spirochaetia bacterium]
MITIEQTLTIPDDRRIHFELPANTPVGQAEIKLTVKSKTEQRKMNFGIDADTPPTPDDIDEFYGCFAGKGIWEGDSVDVIRKIRDEW